MPANPQVGGLARVADGWTGHIRIAVGSAVAEVRPGEIESAASLVSRLIAAAARVHGGRWAAWSTAAGRLVVDADVAFTLVASGRVATRLDFTGGYSGATQYQAEGPHMGAVYPPLGLAVATPSLELASGPVAATTAAAGAPRSPSGQVTIFGADVAEVLEHIDTLAAGDTWDVWVGGRVRARVRVLGAQRQRWGRLVDHQRAVARVLEVAS